MATFRGSNGEVQIDSTAIGELQSWQVDVSRPYLRDDAIGDAARTGTLDMPEWSGEIQLNIDLGDAQQKALLDVLVANTDPPTTTFNGIVESTGPKEVSGNIVPTNASIAAEKGSLVTMSIQFNGEGALTVNWT